MKRWVGTISLVGLAGLAGLAFDAVAMAGDARVGAPFPLDSFDSRSLPAVASAGGTVLVAWIDNEGSSSILAARVRASDGALLDPAGIALPVAAGTGVNGGTSDPRVPKSLAVASDGTDFVVTWTDRSVNAVRIRGSDGAVLDAAPLVVFAANGLAAHVAVTYGAGEYLVAWTAVPSALQGIVGARVTPAGALVDTAPLRIANSFNADDAAVTFDGAHFLVAWDNSSNNSAAPDVFANRVDPATGALLDGPAIGGGVAVCTQAASQSHPAVAFDGTRTVIAWNDARSGGSSTNTTFAARLDPATGALLDGPAASAGVPILPIAPATAPELASDGTGVLVVSGSAAAIVNGSDLTSPFETVAGTVASPGAATFGGGDYVVAWSDGPHIDFTRFAPACGAAVDPGQVAIALPATTTESAPAVAQGSTTALAVWQESRSADGAQDIYGARIDLGDGAVLDSPAIPIATGVGNQIAPAVGFEGGNYLVAWISGGAATGGGPTVSAARVRESDGALLDGTAGSGGVVLVQGASLSSPASFFAPQVAGSAGNFMVAWFSSSGATSPFPLVMNQLIRSSDGARLNDPATEQGGGISGASTAYLTLAGGASDFLVVAPGFTRLTPPTQTPVGLYAWRLRASDATVLDPNGIALSIPPSGAAVQSRAPSVAFDGTSFFVTWDDTLPGGAPSVVGTRLREADGAALDTSATTLALPIAATPLESSGAVTQAEWTGTAFDGTNVVAAWADTRGGVYAARVQDSDAGATVLDGTPADAGVSISPTATTTAALAAASGGRVLSLQGQGGRVTAELIDLEDGGLPPIGTTDAGASDGGTIACSVVDSGVADTGLVDSGAADTGIVDSGVADAGVVDGSGGVSDGGTLADGSPASDAGAPDATPDSGSVDSGGSSSGCAVATGRRGREPWWLLILSVAGLGAVSRRRR